MNERQIFEGALEFETPADRAAFLDKACGGDVDLRDRVDSLLASHDAQSAFLQVPAVDQLRGDVEKVFAQTRDSSQGGDLKNAAADDEVGGPDLSFLQPSSKPGSIGILGHYEILQVLGQGAFGIVFRAFDEKLHRQVAVKAMNPQLAATSPPRKRFLREARSVAAVKHENIVQIYSVEEQPLPYLVMEFVQGQTLQQKLDSSGPLEVPEILHLGRQMAAGLAAAHGLGLIHRDIKPGNLLLEQGAEQKLKITDFGLARAADDASMTNTGVISGTPLYMAPEQALGGTLDARTDLFSLGSVLYQMATGRPPFRAPNTLAVLKRVVEDAPRPMNEIIADTPPWLEAIIMKLLAKDPAERYQSAKELADLFARCQSELQINGPVTCVPVASAKPAATVPPPTVAIPTVPPPVASKSQTSAEKAPQRNPWLSAVPALIATVLLSLYVINRVIDRFNTPATIAVPPDGSVTISSAPPGRTFGKGEWIDVIPLIEPRQDRWNVAKQTGLNNWRIEQGELVVGGDEFSSKLLLPLDSDWPAYECEIEFTRRGGEHGLNLNLPTAAGECPVVFDPPGSVGAHIGNRQQGKVLQAGRIVSTNQRTKLRFEVHCAPNNDRVSVTLNDQMPCEWIGDLDALALVYRENFPQNRRLSLYVHRGGDYVFHRLRARVLDGTATTLRPVPATIASSSASGWHGWPADAPKPAIAPFDEAQAKKHQQEWADYLNVPREWENSIGMKFMLIPPGEFKMGSTPAEIEAALLLTGDDRAWKDCIRSEAPQHTVVLTQPFYLGRHEVTQKEYFTVAGANPSVFSAMGAGKEVVRGMESDNHPVERVNWFEAAEFTSLLSNREKLKPFYFRSDTTLTHLEGTGYRLPTEAEWEFACRAGTTTSYWIGNRDEDLLRTGWFGPNSGARTHAVGELEANPLGLFDIHGNVWEWVQDSWDSEYFARLADQPAIDPVGPASTDTRRLIRGGGFTYGNSSGRSSNRYLNQANEGHGNCGFRIALPIDAVRRALNRTGPAIPKSPSAHAHLQIEGKVDPATGR